MANITIPPGLVRVAWLAPNLTLANASWKNNLDFVTRENAARTTLVLFKPNLEVNNIATLEPNQFYLWKVKTSFQLDESLLSLSVPAAPSVPAPTITSFAPTSGAAGTSVTLTGTGFTGAYAVVFNNVVGVIVGTPTATSITATIPSLATTGTVKVYTAGGVATSGSSFTITVAASAPDPVSTLAASAGNTLASLGWSAPNNNGAAISNYRVEYKLATDSAWTLFGNTTNTTIQVTGLLNGSAYNFRVFTTNSVGTSAASNTANATPQADIAPILSTPSAFHADNSTASQIGLSWEQVANASGYSVQRAADTGFTTNLVTIYTGTALNALDTNALVPGATYYYRLKATAGNGYQDSDYALLKTTAQAPLNTTTYQSNSPNTFTYGGDVFWARQINQVGYGETEVTRFEQQNSGQQTYAGSVRLHFNTQGTAQEGIDLYGQVNDPDQTMVAYSQNGGPFQLIASPPTAAGAILLTLRGLAAGTHTIELRFTKKQGWAQIPNALFLGVVDQVTVYHRIPQPGSPPVSQFLPEAESLLIKNQSIEQSSGTFDIRPTSNLINYLKQQSLWDATKRMHVDFLGYERSAAPDRLPSAIERLYNIKSAGDAIVEANSATAGMVYLPNDPTTGVTRWLTTTPGRFPIGTSTSPVYTIIAQVAFSTWPSYINTIYLNEGAYRILTNSVDSETLHINGVDVDPQAITGVNLADGNPHLWMVEVTATQTVFSLDNIPVHTQASLGAIEQSSIYFSTGKIRAAALIEATLTTAQKANLPTLLTALPNG